MRWVVIVLAALALLVSLPMMGFSVMLFDAPGSENDAGLQGAFFAIFLVPVGALAAIILLAVAKPPLIRKTWLPALLALFGPWIVLIASFASAFE